MSAIRFPRLHVAESIVNRILNANDDIARGASRQEKFKAASAADLELPAPDPVPDPTLLGGEIDLQLQQPQPEVAPDPNVIEGAATGEAAPLEALLTGGM